MSSSTNQDRAVLKRLQTIPNVGPAVSRDLVRLGISHVEDLRDRDPDELYHALCRLDGACPDPCMHDTLAAAIAFATSGDTRPWWAFTLARKARAIPITPPATSGGGV